MVFHGQAWSFCQGYFSFLYKSSYKQQGEYEDVLISFFGLSGVNYSQEHILR